MRALSLLVLAGCGGLGSPQPEPHPGPTLLNLEKVSIQTQGEMLSIRGETKAVGFLGLPSVWAIGFVSGIPSPLASIAADGSFALEVAGDVEEGYRLHFDGEQPGISYVFDAMPNPGRRRLDERITCARGPSSTPATVYFVETLRVGDQAPNLISISNSCDRSITADGVRRVSGPGYVDARLTPEIIDQGGTLNVEIVTSPQRAGTFVELLAIDFADDPPLFITVKGVAR